MKKILLFHLLLVCPALFLVWYMVYPGYIWFLEGESFFTFTPDFSSLQYTLPADWAEYAGAYLLQYFRLIGGGPLIQMLLAGIILFSFDWMIWRIFRNKKLLWLSFIPVAWFISGQFEDATLARSVVWVALSVVLSLLVWGVTAWLKVKAQLKIARFWSSPCCVYVVPCLLFGGSLYFLVTDSERRSLETNCRLERWTDRKEWDAILKTIPPKETFQSPSKLRFALLALSEKGILAERMFAYGVTDPACFLYERQGQPSCCNFNSYFFEAFGFDNEVIHHSFQAGIQSRHGMNFRSMRRLTDVWRRSGNSQMLTKYMAVMKRTSCHKNWLKYRESQLQPENQESQSVAQEKDLSFFIGAHPFLSDMARCVDRDLNNQKAMDYLYCGLLISKDLMKFYSVFNQLNKAEKASLPLSRYYEEALILIAQQTPEVLNQYPITAQKQKEFNRFQTLLSGGAMNQQLLQMQFGDSFWFYFYS